MVEPLKVDDQPKQYDFLLLGEAGNGKTSLAYTLTKNVEKFIPKAGIKSGSKDIIHGSSIDKTKKNQFTVIDTIGFGNEDFKSSIIEEKLLDYLKDHSSIEKITAVLYVIKIDARNSMKKMTETIRNITLFDIKKTLVIVFTGIDQIYYDDEYRKTIEEAFEAIDEILGKNQRQKIVLWINDKPQNKKYMKNIENDDDLKKIYEEEENDLLKAVSYCEPLILLPLSEYVKLLKQEYRKISLEVFKSVRKMKEQEIPLKYECILKMTPNTQGFSAVKTCLKIAKESTKITLGGFLTTGLVAGIAGAPEACGLLALTTGTAGAAVGLSGILGFSFAIYLLPLSLTFDFLKFRFHKTAKILCMEKTDREKIAKNLRIYNFLLMM